MSTNPATLQDLQEARKQMQAYIAEHKMETKIEEQEQETIDELDGKEVTKTESLKFPAPLVRWRKLIVNTFKHHGTLTATLKLNVCSQFKENDWEDEELKDYIKASGMLTAFFEEVYKPFMSDLQNFLSSSSSNQDVFLKTFDQVKHIFECIERSDMYLENASVGLSVEMCSIMQINMLKLRRIVHAVQEENHSKYLGLLKKLGVTRFEKTISADLFVLAAKLETA